MKNSASSFTVSARTSWLASPRADGLAGHHVTNTLTHTHGIMGVEMGLLSLCS
jgi:hypothetical protein